MFVNNKCKCLLFSATKCYLEGMQLFFIMERMYLCLLLLPSVGTHYKLRYYRPSLRKVFVRNNFVFRITTIEKVR